MLLLLCSALRMLVLTSASERTNSTGGEEEGEPVVDVLFPWFSLVIGTFAYFALTRLLPWVPYTAVMFIIGTVIGVAVVRLDRTTLLTESVSDWLNIDSEVLLLVFLPGLVAKDAMQLDATLFQAAFWQCIVFAFPMVLAGTALTALVVAFILPYGWSFNFAMTMGSVRNRILYFVPSGSLPYVSSRLQVSRANLLSHLQILSATDPVAGKLP